jgi:hypothetical protein
MRRQPTASTRTRQVRVERHAHLRPAARYVMRHGTYSGLVDLRLGTPLVQTPSLPTPSEILLVQLVHEAVGSTTTPSGLEGRR